MRGGQCWRGRNTAGEEIVSKPIQAAILVAQGIKVLEAVQPIGVTQVTYYRWRRKAGGLQMDQVKWLKELEFENQRLRKAVSGLTLDKLIMGEALPRESTRVCP